MKKNILELSIVIISYKPSRLLINCLDSIIKNTNNVEYEIIIVVNGFFESLIANDVEECSKNINLKILKIQNNGYGDACNKGMETAKGKYIALLNDDIVLQDNVFYDLINYLSENSNVAVIGPILINQDGSIQKSYSRLPSIVSNIYREIFSDRADNNKHFIMLLKFISNLLKINIGRLSELPQDITAVDCLMGAFFLIPKRVYEITGGFDNKNFFMFLEEGDWFKRISKIGLSIIYYPKNRVIHCGGATTKNNANVYLIQQYKSYCTYYKIHYGIVYLHIYIFFMLIINLVKLLRLILFRSLLNLNDYEYNKLIETHLFIIKVLIDPKFRSINVMKFRNYKYIRPIE
jgi:GT2 family glycosyltransferase